MENKSNEMIQEMSKIMGLGYDHIFTTGIKKLIEDDGFKGPDVDETVHKIAKDMDALSDCESYNSCSECELRDECFVYYLAQKLYWRGYKKQKWISVEDRFPEPDKECLIVVLYNGKRVVIIGEWLSCEDIEDPSDRWYSYEFAAELGWKVTHWMPLPELPKEAE